MRIFFSSVSFVATLIVGAFAFAFTAIQFPGIMRELIEAAQKVPGYLSGLGIPDNYMVWVDILLSGDKLVLLGFVAVTRILFAIVGGILSPLDDTPRSRSSGASRQKQVSDFDQWGKS